MSTTRRSERIAVGVDGSLASHAAVRWAVDHAQRGDTITLVHVWKPSTLATDTHTEAESGAAATSFVEHEVNRVAALHRAEGVSVLGEVVHGNPADGLGAVDADLLVVGDDRDRHAIARLLGSVCGHLLHHAPMPIVIVPAPSHAAEPIAQP